jgi:hypothetical protein
MKEPDPISEEEIDELHDQLDQECDVAMAREEV